MSVPERASPIRPGEVEWDPAPVKNVLKTAISPCTKVAVDASGKCIKEAADQAYPTLPGPVKDWALDASAKEATKCADKAMDRSVDSSFETPASLGSRAILYVKSWV